jgi:hypothetical protein
VLSLAISKAHPYTITSSFLSWVLTSKVSVEVIMFKLALGLT